MFPHLIAMKECHHLTSEDMGSIIGKSRQTYEYKEKCGNFSPSECKAFCKWFNKSFDYLFATMEEIEQIDTLFVNKRTEEGKTVHQEAM